MPARPYINLINNTLWHLVQTRYNLDATTLKKGKLLNLPGSWSTYDCYPVGRDHGLRLSSCLLSAMGRAMEKFRFACSCASLALNIYLFIQIHTPPYPHMQKLHYHSRHTVKAKGWTRQGRHHSMQDTIPAWGVGRGQNMKTNKMQVKYGKSKPKPAAVYQEARWDCCFRRQAWIPVWIAESNSGSTIHRNFLLLTEKVDCGFMQLPFLFSKGCAGERLAWLCLRVPAKGYLASQALQAVEIFEYGSPPPPPVV